MPTCFTVHLEKHGLYSLPANKVSTKGDNFEEHIITNSNWSKLKRLKPHNSNSSTIWNHPMPVKSVNILGRGWKDNLLLQTLPGNRPSTYIHQRERGLGLVSLSNLEETIAPPVRRQQITPFAIAEKSRNYYPWPDINHAACSDAHVTWKLGYFSLTTFKRSSNLRVGLTADSFDGVYYCTPKRLHGHQKNRGKCTEKS